MLAVLFTTPNDINGGESPLGLPYPPAPGREETASATPHAPKLNLTHLKTLILAVGFFVKLAKRAARHRHLLDLKRSMGDINAEEVGEIPTVSPALYPRPRDEPPPQSLVCIFAS